MTVMSAVATRFMLSQSPWQNSAVPQFTLERRRYANKRRARNRHLLTDCNKWEISKIQEWSKIATLRQNCNTRPAHGRAGRVLRVWFKRADTFTPNEPLNSNSSWSG